MNTVEPRFNERSPLYNERFSSARSKLHCKMYGKEHRFNSSRFSQILVITNTIHKR